MYGFPLQNTNSNKNNNSGRRRRGKKTCTSVKLILTVILRKILLINWWDRQQIMKTYEYFKSWNLRIRETHTSMYVLNMIGWAVWIFAKIGGIFQGIDYITGTWFESCYRCTNAHTHTHTCTDILNDGLI